MIFRPLRVTKNLLVLSAILSCQTATAETKLDQMLDRGLTPDQVVDQWGLTPDQMPWAPFECQSPTTAAQFQTKWEQAATICFNRAKAAGIAGAPLDIIGSLALRNETAELHIQMSVGRACMAERGFKIETRRGFEARCAKR